MSQPPGYVTQILKDVSAGNRQAVDKLLEAVYDDLRAMAGNQMRQERADHTLQATALVHEAYVKLIDQREVVWQDRAHFFAIAAQAIRRILVDHARTKNRVKRGGGWKRVDAEDVAAIVDQTDVDLVALDAALAKLADINSLQSRLVEMRFFGGLTNDQIAEVLGIGKRNVHREWNCAKAWLYRELADPADLEDGGVPDGSHDTGDTDETADTGDGHGR